MHAFKPSAICHFSASDSVSVLRQRVSVSGGVPGVAQAGGAGGQGGGVDHGAAQRGLNRPSTCVPSAQTSRAHNDLV